MLLVDKLVEKKFSTRVWIVIAALLVSAGFPATASATELSLFGAYWSPSASSGITGLGAKASFGEQPVRYEARVTLFADVLDDELSDAFGLELDVVPVDLGVNYPFVERELLEVFATSGVSYFLLDANFGSVDDEIGYYSGVGVKYGPERFGFLGELLYRDTFSSISGVGGLGGIDLRAGVTFDF